MKKVFALALILVLTLSTVPIMSALSGGDTNDVPYTMESNVVTYLSSLGEPMIIFDMTYPVFSGESEIADILNDRIAGFPEETMRIFNLDSTVDNDFTVLEKEFLESGIAFVIRYDANVTYNRNGYLSYFEYAMFEDKREDIYLYAGFNKPYRINSATECDLDDFLQGSSADLHAAIRFFMLESCGYDEMWMWELSANGPFVLDDNGVSYYLDVNDGVPSTIITFPYTSNVSPIIDLAALLSSLPDQAPSVISMLTPLTVYTISTSENTPTYSDIEGVATGRISYKDECVILQIYEHGFCQVRYPLDKGGTRTQLVGINVFLMNFPYNTASVTKKASAYRRSSGSATIGSVDTRDTTVWICGEENGRVQIIYNVTGSNRYKAGWVDASALD